MKRKISVMFLGVAGLLACAGIVTAGELLAFDTVYKNPQEAIKVQGKSVGIPVVPQAATDRGASSPAPKLVMLKELLKDIPAADRADFFSSLVLKDGRVVSFNLEPLEKNLSAENVGRIKNTIFYRPDNKSLPKTSSPARYAFISKMFKGIPAEVRNEFLNSLTFENGSFVSAYTGGLEGNVSRGEVENIIKTIATTPGPLREFNTKTLCLGAVCDNAACYQHNDDDPYCIEHKKWTCDSSCGS